MTASFALRMGINTPIALKRLLHLDGLLCSLAAASGRQWDDIPLERYEGIWQGSAAMLEVGPFGPVHSQQMRLKHVRRDTVPVAVAETLPKGDRIIGTMSPERNQLTPYPCLAGVRAVWFTGRGDPGAVADLAARAPGIGGMGRTGYGRTTGVEVMPVDDAVLTGLVLGDGRPARTMPVDLWGRIGDAEHPHKVVSDERPFPPYWTGREEACVSPMQVDLMGTRAELVAMMGFHRHP